VDLFLLRGVLLLPRFIACFLLGLRTPVPSQLYKKKMLSLSLSFRVHYSLSELRLIINSSITCSTSIPLLSPARQHLQSEVTFAVTDLFLFILTTQVLGL